MTLENFVHYAESFGYEIKFIGLGMAYIMVCGVKLTETMDAHLAHHTLAQIGMAIMADTLRSEN